MKEKKKGGGAFSAAARLEERSCSYFFFFGFAMSNVASSNPAGRNVTKAEISKEASTRPLRLTFDALNAQS